MSIKRAELKMIVKECLLEILNEGLGAAASRGAGPMPRSSLGGTVQERASARRRPDFDPRLDTKLGGGRQATEALKEAIKQESRGNPVLADMLADTAMTTLPNQLANGDSMGTPSAGSSTGGMKQFVGTEQFAGDPADHFQGAEARADGSSHWADLAFMQPGKKSA